MKCVSVCVFSLLAAGVAVLPVYGQAVISTHSGVVHYFEGAVTVAGQPLAARFGVFNIIPDGADLRTEQGRAEILLTPGVILRVGEKSAVRMVDTALASTKVELLAGSAIIEAAEPADGTSVTLTYKDWSVRQTHAGVYRVNCEPPNVEVREGSVDVAAAGSDAPVTVDKGAQLAFEKILTPEKAAFAPADAFTDWADGRAQSISADNAIAADIQDPANMTGSSYPMDAFTYFPLLGLPAPMNSQMSPSMASYYSALYGTSPLLQPGFYALYLPGYTYRPMFLRLPMGIGGLGHSLYPPVRLPSYPVTGYPRPPLTRPGLTPLVRPGTPMVIRPATPVAVHPVIIHK